MCGRFTLRTSPAQLAQEFDLEQTPDLSPRFNIAPSQTVATIGVEAPPVRRALRLRRWGLVPGWAEDPSVGARMINARSETAAERPAFREAFRRRRCLVPADGFYEWGAVAGSAGLRQPYHVGLAEGGLFAIAGLWEAWRGPDGEVLESCALLTVPANALLAPIHDRMPAILAPSSAAAWLDPEARDPDALHALLQPFPEDALRARPVSPRVNDVRVDDASLLARFEPPPTPVQGVLF